MTDPVVQGHVTRSRVRLEANPNHEETENEAALDATRTARRMSHELQRVHQRRKPWPKESRWPNRDQ
jgi:hypothetical protein